MNFTFQILYAIVHCTRSLIMNVYTHFSLFVRIVLNLMLSRSFSIGTHKISALHSCLWQTHTYTLTQSTAKMLIMWFFTNIQMFTTFCFTPSILSNVNKYSVKCHYFGVVGVQTKYRIRSFFFVCFASNCSNATLSETHASNSMYVHVWTRKKKNNNNNKNRLETDRPTDQLSIFCIGTKTPCIKSIF